MKPLQRVLGRLSGEIVDRPPNFNLYMTIAAHSSDTPLRLYYLDYRVLANANRAMVEDFGTYLYQAISDPYREVADLGAEIEFPDDNLSASKIPLIRTEDDLKKLKIITPEDGRRAHARVGRCAGIANLPENV